MSKNVGQLNIKITGDSTQLEKTLDNTISDLNKTQNEIENTNNSSLDTLKNTILSVFSTIKSIGTQMKTQLDSITTPINNINNGLKTTYSEAQMMRLPLDEFTTTLSSLNKEQLQGLFDKVTNEIYEAKINTMQLKQELNSISKTKINSEKIKELKSVINETSVDSQILKTKLSLIKSELKSLQANNIKEIGNNLNSINQSTKKLGNQMSSSFKKGLTSLKRFALTLVGLEAGFSYLLQSIKQYISSSDTLTAKTTGISQALSQSLAPYTNIAISVLQKLVNWIILAIAYFTTFINKIFGTSIAIGGLSGSFKDLTKNTKKSVKEAKKGLAAFDDFNILETSQSVDTGISYTAPDFTGLGITEDQFAGITAFGTWLEEHREQIQWLLITITAIVAIWTLWNVAVGIFNALMLVNPIVLILMAAIAVIGLIIIYWDDLKNAAITVLQLIGDTITWLVDSVIKPIIDYIKNQIETLINLIVAIVTTAFNLIKDSILLFINTVIGYWKTLYDTIKTIINGVWTVVKTIFTGIKDFISKILRGDIKGAFNSLKNTVVSVLKTIWNTVKDVFGNVWTFVSNIAKGIGDVFGDAIRGTVNAIIGFAEGTVNGFIKAINAAINVINAIPGVNIKKLKELSIPRLAKGGVATGPQVVEIGEGRYNEAVIPLGNSPQFAEMKSDIAADVVDALNSKNYQPQEITIINEIGGYEFGRKVIKVINDTQNQAGMTLLEV